MTKSKKISQYMFIGLVLLFSMQVSAIDVQINVTGTLQIPPCKINDNKVIEVDFDNISITDIENEKHQKKVSIPVNCSDSQGDAWIKVTGTKLSGNTNVLATSIQNFGIALYQGSGMTTKLNLGDGESNGQNTIGYPLTDGFSGKSFTFTAVPVKNGVDELSTGKFSASANMSISYF